MKTLISIAALALVGAALAADATAEASLNATVQAAGPRTGSSGTNFFNIEGSSNGNFASFGVADFNASDFSFGFGVGSITRASLMLTESNAAFTTPGTVHFYFATGTSVSIANDGTSPLMYNNAGGANSNGVDNLLGSLVDLGTGAFTASGSTGTGTVDTYTLTLGSAGEAYLMDALSDPSGIVRLVVAAEGPGSAGIAATWAGSTNSTLAGPTLTVSAEPVPEPASMAVLGLGALALIRRRRIRK